MAKSNDTTTHKHRVKPIVLVKRDVKHRVKRELVVRPRGRPHRVLPPGVDERIRELSGEYGAGMIGQILSLEFNDYFGKVTIWRRQKALGL